MRTARHLSCIVIVMTMTAAALPARADTVTVTIEGLTFIPAEVRAKTGDTIEWVNKDAFAHTATVKDSWEVMIPPHKSASRIMQRDGPVDYFCRFHPNMRGRIRVTAR